MKVYVIGEGEYSDFRVISVFKTLPEKYNKENCPYQISIEEFELDVNPNPAWKYFPYVVCSNISTEALIVREKCSSYYDSSEEIKNKNIVSLHKFTPYEHTISGTAPDWIKVVVDAKNERHAIKIATDLFAQYLVEHPRS